MFIKTLSRTTAFLALLFAGNALAQSCASLPGHGMLTNKLKDAQSEPNGGFGLNMWGTIVDRDGRVCAVAMTGKNRGDQWPGSRVISAQKANTANSFSLPGLALSTANLWAATQPGGSLYGLQHSNPVDSAVAYGSPNHTGGNANNYGKRRDPMVGHFIGGVNVFGGGLALYKNGKIVGAIGVSGDSSCADHNIAWRTRALLGLDSVPGGVGPNGLDGINFDLDADNSSAGGFGHPTCNDDSISSAQGIGSGG